MLLSSKLALPAYVSDARSAAQLPGKFGDVSAGVAAGSTCQLPRLAWQQQEQLLRRRVCKTVQTYSLPREGPEPDWGTTCASIYNPTEAESKSEHSLAFNFDVSMVFIQRQNLILETAEPWRVVQFYLP